ncbi:MAG TPA: winged helix DNA-binding domain-containing protein, partial [Candidatus Limnocylindrales bacterium]|nr:winged helix DNA-binding domain-containing protein [Candidatus Limnocylindrales bacterium]
MADGEAQRRAGTTAAPVILSQRHLNRALLARQLLLERSPLPLPVALEQVGGLQTQYAPSGYVGLWTRLAGFRRHDLTRALEAREVVQATLMRATIHLVSAREFWHYAEGIRESRRAWLERVDRSMDPAAMDSAGARIREALAGGPRDARELGDLGSGFLGRLGVWVDLVRVPPSGTWQRRRADRLALADAWLGPSDSDPSAGQAHLVKSYLRAFGPAPWRDIASWAGISVTDARAAGARIELLRYRDEQGRELLDLPGAPLPDPDTPAPVRFLPHWDANLLVHARRTGLLPEEHRPRVFSSRNPFSVGTYLVDGRVVGAWSARDGRIELDAFEPISKQERRLVEDER